MSPTNIINRRRQSERDQYSTIHSQSEPAKQSKVKLPTSQPQTDGGVYEQAEEVQVD